MSSARWTVSNIGDLIRRINANYDEEIWMRNIQVSDRSAAFIADALITSTVLSEVWLSNCDISDRGAMELSRVLRHPGCCIKFLNLSGNEIGDEGAAAIFSALECNTSVQSIFLNENCIGDEGILALAKMLKTNKTLREVYLWDNRLTDRGCEEIARTMMLNKTITKCEIDNGDEDEINEVQDKEIIHTIRTYCERNVATQRDKLIERNPHNFRRTTREVMDFEKV
jgi:Ran GTPase-activating protein (RanGAP) involved in mRNA processing and transport